jgi:hypothetical protein
MSPPGDSDMLEMASADDWTASPAAVDGDGRDDGRDDGTGAEGCCGCWEGGKPAASGAGAAWGNGCCCGGKLAANPPDGVCGACGCWPVKAAGDGGPKFAWNGADCGEGWGGW